MSLTGSTSSQNWRQRHSGQDAGMKILAVDTEYQLVNPAWAKLAGFSYSWTPGFARYCLPTPAAIQFLQDQTAEADVVVMHNSPGDCLVLENAGFKVPYDKLHDTIVMSAVLQEPELSLKALAYDKFHVLMTALDDIIGTGKKRRDPSEVPVEEMWEYGCADADMTGRLFRCQMERLEADPQLLYIYEDVERPCFEACVEMQRNGVLLDWEKFTELELELEGMVQLLRGELQQLVGDPQFNPGSNLQVQHFLYDVLWRTKQVNVKTGNVSADERSVMALREQEDHPFLAKLLEWRGYTAMLTRYLKPFPGMADCNGWLHPTFKQWGASRTGRFASENPNFQNIPVRS